MSWSHEANNMGSPEISNGWLPAAVYYRDRRVCSGKLWLAQLSAILNSYHINVFHAVKLKMSWQRSTNAYKCVLTFKWPTGQQYHITWKELIYNSEVLKLDPLSTPTREKNWSIWPCHRMSDCDQITFFLYFSGFACSVWVLSKFSGFLPQSKDVHSRWIRDSKFPIGVNVTLCIVRLYMFSLW